MEDNNKDLKSTGPIPAIRKTVNLIGSFFRAALSQQPVKMDTTTSFKELRRQAMDGMFIDIL